jgi:anti-anti-sigma factor
VTFDHNPTSYQPDPHPGDVSLRHDASAAVRREVLIASATWFDPPQDGYDSRTAAMDFSIHTAAEGELMVITVYGDLDLATAPQLESELTGLDVSTQQRIIVDLSGVTFMACVGMTVLLNAHMAVSHTGSFAVVAAGRSTTLPLHLAGLDHTLALYPSLRSAIASMSRFRYTP